MKKLGKLTINSAKLLGSNELSMFRGGLSYMCCCWYCSGCGVTCGPADIPEGQDPNEYAQQHGGYESCSCVGGY